VSDVPMLGAVVDFDAPITTMPWGRSTYTIIRLPDAVADWRAAGVKRLTGTIDDVAVNLAITTAPVIDGAFVWAGASLLRRVEAEAGEVVRCSFGPADPDEVLVPEDVASALDEHDLLGTWEVLRSAQQRSMLYQVESARTDATRLRRIEALLRGLPGTRS
jgi:hypothetical protein